MATDIEKRAAGLKAILYFHDQSQNYSNYPFMNNVQGLYDQIDAISPSWLKNFGNGVIGGKLDQAPWYSSDPAVKPVMEDLANELQGKAPANLDGLQLFYNALVESTSSVIAQMKQIAQGAFIDTPIQIKQAAVTTVKVAGAAVAGFAAFKVAALAIAGLGLVFGIYKYMRPKKVSNPKRKIRKRK